jgi:hypothetical protein
MSKSRIEPVYALLASHIGAYRNCIVSGNVEWKDRHREAIEQIARDVLPSGSGIDSGTTIDIERSTQDKIVMSTAFHHMDDEGFYDGWTEHRIIARPSFIDALTLSISGRDRNDIKEYLAQTFKHILTSRVEQTWDDAKQRYEHRIVTQG